jgi:hypothetical protein
LTIFQGDGGRSISFCDNGSNWPDISEATVTLEIAANRDLTTVIVSVVGVVNSPSQVTITPTAEDTDKLTLLNPRAYEYRVIANWDDADPQHLAGPDDCTVLW